MYHNIDANINVGVVVLFEAKFETSLWRCPRWSPSPPQIKVYPSDNQTWLAGVIPYKWHVKYRKSMIDETIFSKHDL